MGVTFIGIAGRFVQDRCLDHQDPLILFQVAHLTFVVHTDDLERFHVPWKHLIDVVMAVFAIWIVVRFISNMSGRVGQIILCIIHVHILNSGHLVDDIQCMPQSHPVILQHMFI